MTTVPQNISKIGDNIFYILVLGIVIGIIISYSQLLTLVLGIFLGLCYKNRSIFDFINEQINKIND